MKRAIYIIIIIGLLCLSFHLWREKRNAAHMYQSNLEVLNDSISTYKNDLGHLVAEKKAFEGSRKQLLELIKTQGEQLQEALKKTKPTTATKIVTQTRIDTVRVPYEVPVDVEFNLPFSSSTAHYSINGIADNYGVNIYNLTIPNEQSVVVGKKKIGFLKWEYRAEVTNSNPLISVTELNSFTFKDPKKRFSVGAFAGVNINGKSTVGVGAMYSLFSF